MYETDPTSQVTPQSLSRKEREFARREKDILDAAMRLFDCAHWEEITVEQIAKEAEVGKGTVYKHFPSKEALYAQISLEFHESLLNTFYEVERKQPILKIFKTIIRHSFHYFLNHPVPARVSFYCKRYEFVERMPSEYRERFELLEVRFDEFIEAILKEGIAAGTLPNRPLNELTAGLEATFDGAMTMMWNREPADRFHMDDESFIHLISDFMVAGLAGLNRGEDK